MSNAPNAENRLDSNGFTSEQWRALALVWLIYGTCYFCRVNIGSANPRITEELLDPAEMGLVLMGFKVAYGVGQLVNGQLTERFGARWILWLGMIGAVAANVFFGLGTGFGSLLGAWSLNGFCQAGLWPPCVKIMANWFAPLQRGRAMGVIGTSYQLGSAAAYAAMGYIILGFGNQWRAAFFVPAGLFAFMALPAAWRLRERPYDPPAQFGGVTTTASAAVAQNTLAMLETLRLTLGNPRIWLLGVGLAGLNVARFGFLEWAPKHLKEAQGIEITGASLQTAVLPLGGVLGAIAAGWISDRLFQSRRAPVAAGMLVVVGLLTLIYDWSVAHLAWPAIVACLIAIGFFIYGPQIILVGSAPQDLARRGTTAAAAGFVDAMGYGGAALGSLITGWFIQTRDWHTTIYFWAAAAFVAALSVAILWNARANEAD